MLLLLRSIPIPISSSELAASRVTGSAVDADLRIDVIVIAQMEEHTASQPATSRPESAVHRHRRAVERLLMHHRDTTNNSIAVDFDCFTLSTSVPGKPKAMLMMACQVSRP